MSLPQGRQAVKLCLAARTFACSGCACSLPVFGRAVLCLTAELEGECLYVLSQPVCRQGQEQ